MFFEFPGLGGFGRLRFAVGLNSPLVVRGFPAGECVVVSLHCQFEELAVGIELNVRLVCAEAGFTRWTAEGLPAGGAQRLDCCEDVTLEGFEEWAMRGSEQGVGDVWHSTR